MNSSNNKDYQTKIKWNQIYNQDCIELINQMIKENIKVDAIITDPPYNISKKNNFKTIGRNGIDFGNWDKNFNQLKWLNNINKIIKPGGSIIIFNDWRNLGNISLELEKQGFEIKDILRWIKSNPMPRNTTRRYVTDYEFAIWAVNPGKWIFNKEVDKPYIVPEFKHSIVIGNRIHPTEKSVKLIEEIIKIHTNEGDLVFDPFSGSGAISFAANKLNRFYIGCEISKLYYEKSLRRIKEFYVKPTFNHLGNKYRMIDDLLRNFPKNDIDYFVDVFAGSGVVSLNYQTPKKVFLNDKDEWLTKILDYLMNTDLEIVIKKTEQIIKKYKLPIDVVEKDYKVEYKKLTNDFNDNQNIDKLLVLILYGFNQQIRFNSKNKWNIPAGKFYWNAYHRNKLIEYCNKAKLKTYSIHSQDFEIFVQDILNQIDKQKTLFYFDPPYYITNATYNTNWTKEHEIKLINILEYLTENGYKWCLSNVLESKGNQNILLKKFVDNNKNINIEYLDTINYKNSNYQRKNDTNFKDIEVLIKGNI